MKTKVIYPGSFNPIHIGHQQVINIAKSMFDEVYVVIAQNPDKPTIDNIHDRIHKIKEIYNDEIHIICSDKMTGRLAKEMDAYIIKGVRNAIDFQNELDQASFNRNYFGVETILVPSEPQSSYISSSLIRELKKYRELNNDN